MKDRNQKHMRPPKPTVRGLMREITEAAELIERLTTQNQQYEQQLEIGGRFMTVLVEREIERSARCVITKAEVERAPTLWDGVRHEYQEGEGAEQGRIVLHLVPKEPGPDGSGGDAQDSPGPDAVAANKEERLH